VHALRPVARTTPQSRATAGLTGIVIPPAEYGTDWGAARRAAQRRG
jgi:hypothetical protein